jgi:hypothetical protein
MIVSIAYWVNDISAVVIAATRDGADEFSSLVPPALDRFDDSVAVVCANSHALRVPERVAVAGKGTGLTCTVLKR